MTEFTGTRGQPRTVFADVYWAPVHINVGGTTYTTTLTTLTKYPNSKLAKLFNGTLAITLDPVNRHYFLDADGSVFTHILNFLRYDKLLLPEDFNQLPLLKEQVEFFELEEILAALKNIEKEENEEEREAEVENLTSQLRRRRKRRTAEGNRDKKEQGGKVEEAAIEKGEVEAGGDSDVVIVDVGYQYSNPNEIMLYSSAKLSLKKPLPQYHNLQKGVGGIYYKFFNGKWDEYEFPHTNQLLPCLTHILKQLLDKGYTLSGVVKQISQQHHSYWEFFFTRMNKCNVDQSCDAVA